MFRTSYLMVMSKESTSSPS